MAKKPPYSVTLFLDIPVQWRAKLGVAPNCKKQEFKVNPTDFSLTWMDFFLKAKHDKFAKGMKDNKLTIKDKRPYNEQVWSLKSTIKQFIDSFKRIKTAYNGMVGSAKNTGSPRPVEVAGTSNGMRSAKTTTLAKNLVNNVRPVRENASNPGPSGRPVGRPGMKRPLPSGSSSPPVNAIRRGEVRFNDSGTTRPIYRNGLRPAPIIPAEALEDDSASMAPTVDSQESQDDLIRAGITIENIQPMVTQNLVSRLDNNMLLRIRHELQGLVDNQRYPRVVKYAPNASAALLLIFGIKL